MVYIEGMARFRFEDRFTDPVDHREFAAWLRERPDRLWRLLQTVGDLVGIGSGPQSALLEIDESDVLSIFTAVSGWGNPEGFVWLGGDQEVIYASDPRNLATTEASGLGRPTGPCQGFHSTRLDAEPLLGQWRSMRSDE